MDWIDFRTILITALVFIPLERLLALHMEQKIFRKQWLSDVTYLIFNGIPVKLGLFVVFGSMLFLINRLMPDFVEAYVSAQPIWLQTIEVLIIADIGFYLAHRAFHKFPFLWRFHSIHHSIEEMDWLAAHRVHPVDQVLTNSMSMVPVFALGFSAPAIAIYVVIYHWFSMLIHSNTKFNFGIFKWLFSTPQFHHWHHANHKEAYDKNFAALLPVIDILGGTLHMPGDDLPEKYGTDDPVPTRIDQQMIYPFLPTEEESKELFDQPNRKSAG